MLEKEIQRPASNDLMKGQNRIPYLFYLDSLIRAIRLVLPQFFKKKIANP